MLVCYPRPHQEQITNTNSTMIAPRVNNNLHRGHELRAQQQESPPASATSPRSAKCAVNRMLCTNSRGPRQITAAPTDEGNHERRRHSHTPVTSPTSQNAADNNVHDRKRQNNFHPNASTGRNGNAAASGIHSTKQKAKNIGAQPRGTAPALNKYLRSGNKRKTHPAGHACNARQKIRPNIVSVPEGHPKSPTSPNGIKIRRRTVSANVHEAGKGASTPTNRIETSRKP